MGALVASAWGRAVRPVAPNMSLDLVGLNLEVARHLVSGAIDIAILPDPSDLNLPATIDTQAYVKKEVMRQGYRSCVRKDHPLSGRDISLDDFLAYEHILVSPEDRPRGMVDQYLDDLERQRKIAYRTTSFLLAMPMVQYSNCILTGPEPLIALMQDQIMPFDPPLPLQPTTLYAVWHPNWTHDARHQWLRNAVFERLPECPLGPSARHGRT
jgi:DNA-binding transcriptional LysR family regulator